MDKLLIVGNLKSYKTENEAKEWLESFKKTENLSDISDKKEVVLCPPFTLLPLFKNFIKDNNLSVSLGAQDVSPFDEGAYTGEINAKQEKDFAEYVLIGHSERRTNFNEGDELLAKKVEQALSKGLNPIYFVQSEGTSIPGGVKIVAYEPIAAIGSGTPDNPDNADKIALSIKEKGEYKVLYGGSVTGSNVKEFTEKDNLDGVLVGGASLNPNDFIQIIQNA
jgi:triosephosphate isomerase